MIRLHITEKGKIVGKMAFITKFNPVKVDCMHVFRFMIKSIINKVINIVIIWFLLNLRSFISIIERIIIKSHKIEIVYIEVLLLMKNKKYIYNIYMLMALQYYYFIIGLIK